MDDTDLIVEHRNHVAYITINRPEKITHLSNARVAKNYLPEKLVVVDAMPTTPSGKIQKFKLRDEIA